MARNLVICCDGTNNQFGSENTSVVRALQSVVRDVARQAVYYDPGVGTMPEPGLFTRMGEKISTAASLAFGFGLVRNVEQAYRFLMEHHQPMDRVYMFGFSRGAYTVRVLAGLLHSLGLLLPGSQNLVPYAIRLFQAVRGTREYWRLCREFRRTFSRSIPDRKSNRFPTHFIGAWDTVSSVGWAWDPTHFPFTAKNPSAITIRHAVAVDERRWFYRQNLFRQAGSQDLEQRWFSGVHSDVGGGYPEDEGGLWRPPFTWILREAEERGLLVDRIRLKQVLSRSEPPEKPWAEKQHESLHGGWWLAEFFPKMQSRRGSSARVPRIGLGRRRYVEENQVMDKATLLRIRDTQYSPPNLSDEFLARVRGLQKVPDVLPYHN